MATTSPSGNVTGRPGPLARGTRLDAARTAPITAAQVSRSILVSFLLARSGDKYGPFQDIAREQKSKCARSCSADPTAATAGRRFSHRGGFSRRARVVPIAVVDPALPAGAGRA